MIASRFMEWYKNSRTIIKVILSIFLPIMAILWVLGSLTYVDRLIMFIIGAIGGMVAMYYLYPQIIEIFNKVMSLF